MFLIWFLSTFSNFWLRAWPLLSKILRTLLEQGSATYIPWAVSGLRSQTSIRDPLCDFRKSLATQPNPALKLPQHLTKPFFFLKVLNYKLAKNYLKIWWIPFFFFLLSNDPKTCKIVLIWRWNSYFFLGKITNIAQNDPMAWGGGCLPADLCMWHA